MSLAKRRNHLGTIVNLRAGGIDLAFAPQFTGPIFSELFGHSPSTNIDFIAIEVGAK
jgi:hypothetical protein